MFLNDEASSEEFADTLGGRIVSARESADLTTSQLARRLGIKTQTLQGWETDRSEPRPNRLLTLAGMLNVSPTWLLTGAGESPVDSLDNSELKHIRDVVTRLRGQARSLVLELEQLEERLESYQRFET